MRVIDPQSAVLTNIEVLAYLTANPPRRPPNPPPNSRHWVPSPDLRDHNTVVKEIHNYATRLSPHIYKYPKYTHQTPEQLLALAQSQSQSDTPTLPPIQSDAPTPMDVALRDLITQLQPYGLTKGEVLMIVNLGIGVDVPSAETAKGEEGEGEDGAGGEVNGDGMEVDGEQGEGGGGGGGGLSEEDYGALALLDTVVEEREERLSEEDVGAILGIIRGTLGREIGRG